ncbi:alpha-galactosidase [Poseidonocella pacifica]|uniref:alpha-galactosidase n=1 Tax=Poseidonocella pacifica TaxID=871651 RepID=A0A1I0XVD6_9RHOB|nr:alpha-galactosidase [Poseidonocella pacifica]SFB04874.1 alpha-galactosidase [Poseidonocella pacifica]
MSQYWRLDGPEMTLVLCSEGTELPHVAYWGASLPFDEDLGDLVAATQPDITGGMLDALPAITLCPQTSATFPGQPGLSLRDGAGRSLFPAFTLVSVDEREDRLTVRAEDSDLGTRYVASIRYHPTSQLLELSAELETDTPVAVDWLCAPVLPAPQDADRMISFSGRWIGEFQTAEVPWTPGAYTRHAPTGRSGHEHPPLLYLPSTGATNTGGSCRALHLGWSGGHSMIAEELPDGRRQVQFGKARGSHLKMGRLFSSGPLYAAFSRSGHNGCAVAFQRHVHDVLTPSNRSARPRPVHYNCWEAIYFDHDLDALKDIVARAADLGAERFVLDDGWFGLRDDDCTSLGDWTVDTRKYPDGLSPLIDHIQSLGMHFGIWFEPEMINPDSELYRVHPDWILGPADQLLGRQQLVLDLSKDEVRDYLFDAISDILRSYPVDYVKWDHNRVLPYADATQTSGVYDLFDRLVQAFPDVEFETCASGGGRIDFGILARTGRVWLSDSNDALERLRIQHDAALLLPASVTGSHVGPRHCHSSHRTLSMPFRAWVAAERHLGYEMDPRELTDAEIAVLKRVTAWWKANRDWRMEADIHRLDSDDPAIIAEQQIARSGERFVVFAGKAATSAQISPRPVRFTALDPAARYRLTLANPEDISNLSRGRSALRDGALTLSGRFMMEHGVQLPYAVPEQIWVIEGTRT